MEKIRDVVCGREIDEDKSVGSYGYQGKLYHFCSESCKDDFRKNPSSYIK